LVKYSKNQNKLDNKKHIQSSRIITKQKHGNLPAWKRWKSSKSLMQLKWKFMLLIVIKESTILYHHRIILIHTMKYIELVMTFFEFIISSDDISVMWDAFKIDLSNEDFIHLSIKQSPNWWLSGVDDQWSFCSIYFTLNSDG